MVKIKTFLFEYGVLISWLITVTLDTQYNFIGAVIENQNLVNFIRVAGSALLAYMTENKFRTSTYVKQTQKKIGVLTKSILEKIK